MVTSLISVQSKKIYSRQTPKIYSTRKQKVLFRNSNHLEKLKIILDFFSKTESCLETLDFWKSFSSDFFDKNQYNFLGSIPLGKSLQKKSSKISFLKKFKPFETLGNFFQGPPFQKTDRNEFWKIFPKINNLKNELF